MNSNGEDEFEMYFPKIKRIKRGGNKRSKEYSFKDLKRFTESATSSRNTISEWKQSVNNDKVTGIHDNSDSDSDNDGDIIDLTTGKSLAEGNFSMFVSNVKGLYPGERIFLTKEFTSSNVKNVSEIVADVDNITAEETLYNALAFAQSTQELAKIKCAVRRILSLNSRKWRPKVEQFLAILMTAFRADFDQLFPQSKVQDFVEKAFSYSEMHFLTKSKKKALVTVSGDHSFERLNNLDALLEILSAIDWEATSSRDNDADIFEWVRLLLTLSLDVECRSRFAFQASIQNCLRRLCCAKKIGWNDFCKNVGLTIAGDSHNNRHHCNMVQLCSLLPVCQVDGVELRTVSALICVFALLDGGDTVQADYLPAVIPNLLELLERALRVRGNVSILCDASSLSGLLELIQLALTPATIAATSSNDLRRMTTIIQAMINKRPTSDGVAANELHMSLTDRMFLHCLVNVTVDKIKIYSKNPNDSIFLFNNVGETNSAQLEKTEEGGETDVTRESDETIELSDSQ